MHIKQIFLLFYTFFVVLISVVVMLSIFGVIPYIDISKIFAGGVLGEQSSTYISPQVGEVGTKSAIGSPVPTHQVVVTANVSPVFIQPIITSSPGNSVGIVTALKEIPAGDLATFTWFVNGTPAVINSTTVYLGKTSTPGPLGVDLSPASTAYTTWLREFTNGTYNIPLTFTASTPLEMPGTYFARVYAQIDGKHFWGDEFTVSVSAKPKHEIRLVDTPVSVKKGEGMTFVWEVSGPQAVTGFTVIAVSNQSNPGNLENVALTQTPYTTLVNDFTHGNINVPMRFIGNARASESGVFYVRALVFIENKNIWSDEKSFTVE